MEKDYVASAAAVGKDDAVFFKKWKIKGGVRRAGARKKYKKNSFVKSFLLHKKVYG